MKKLDRTRHFGTVSPGAENGALYHQDGIYFDAHDDAILTPEQVQAEAAAQVEAAEKAKKPTKKAVEASTSEADALI